MQEVTFPRVKTKLIQLVWQRFPDIGGDECLADGGSLDSRLAYEEKGPWLIASYIIIFHPTIHPFCGQLHGLVCIKKQIVNMSEDTKLFTIAEEGCLRVSSYIRRIVYHRSLNVLLVFSSNGPRETEIKVVVLDIASGTVLHDTKLSLAQSNSTGSDLQGENVVFDDELLDREIDGIGLPTFKGKNVFPLIHNKRQLTWFGWFPDPLKCLSIAERGTMIVAHNGFLGVRKDFGRALLMESILRPPVMSEEDIVHVELPHNEVKRYFTFVH